MRVGLEHPQRLVAGDRGDFHHIQALFEEAAGSFVAKSVESKAGNASASKRAGRTS
jgi:hypothetical protein